MQFKEADHFVDDVVELLIRPRDEGDRWWHAIAIGGMTEPQLRVTVLALDFLLIHCLRYDEALKNKVRRARSSVSRCLNPH
jgi:hypothetical protein